MDTLNLCRIQIRPVPKLIVRDNDPAQSSGAFQDELIRARSARNLENLPILDKRHIRRRIIDQVPKRRIGNDMSCVSSLFQ